MATPVDESRQGIHAADENHDPDAEIQTPQEPNQDDNRNEASPKRNHLSSEDLTAQQYSDSVKPDNYRVEAASSLDAKQEDNLNMNGPQQNNYDEHHLVREQDGGPHAARRPEEPYQSDSGVVEGNGSAPVEGSSTELINLFVRNVAKHVMEQQLVDLFSKYGKVNSAVVVRDPHSKECRGFGFVKMYTEEGAREAIAALQEFDFEGRKISVERAKRSEPHSRTPGAYMGIDRRIRDRYAGMKRHRDYEVGRYPPYPPHYEMRGGGYRGRYYDLNRPRQDERPWDYRIPYDNQPFDDRDRLRRRYNTDGPRYPAPRDLERDQRYREREPPVPRESADDYI